MKKDFNNKKGGGGKFKKDGGNTEGGKRPFKKQFSDRPERGNDGERPKRTFGDIKPERGGGKRADSGDRPKRSFNDERPKRSFGEDRPKRNFDKREDGEDRPKRSFGEDRPKRSFGKREDGADRPKRSFGEDRPKRSFGKREDGEDRPKRSFGEDRPKRSFDKREDGEGRPKRSFDKDRQDKPYGERKPQRSFGKKDGGEGKADRKPKRTFSDVMNEAFIEKPANKEPKEKKAPREKTEEEQAKPVKKTRQTSFDRSVGNIRSNRGTDVDAYIEKKLQNADKPKKRRRHEEEDEEAEMPAEQMPLNKYIAHSGECSRREAAELVKQGKVKVNGELVTDPGYKVAEGDKVTVAGKKMTLQTDMVYILLNKPKGYLTTTDDPEGRKTVMDLVSNSGAERVFPVGRLDRNTTGLLLLTNDGALAQKLSHPSYSMKKIYQVTLDKNLTKADFEKIAEGVELEDGVATVDAIAYLEKKNELGLEIHIGRNRIVRRIFEHLGYEVEKLDRVMYAGLTKKNLPRGKWRFLNEKEVILLKHFKS